MKLDVLLTDGNYQNTYAILRALKEKNLTVGIIFNYKPSVCFFSRYVDKRFFIKSDIVKNPDESNLKAYLVEIIKILHEYETDVLLPVGNVSYRFASLFKKELERFCRIPVVNYDLMEIAQDKSKTFEYAEKNNIPIPFTLRLSVNDDIDDVIGKVKFPCVIKKTNYDEAGVIYCNTKEELKINLLSLTTKRKNHQSMPIIQEYVKGEGTGYYGIYNNGKRIGYFMHERIHEFPITGGASTLAKSVYNADLEETGNRVLEGLKWHGVAMVEFKRDSNAGSLKLMEINPKFWGSLELSYKAGINFPYLAYLLAMNKPIPESSYRTEVYFRWTLPYDLLWYRFASRENRKQFKALKAKVTINSNIHWDDPATIFFNVVFTILKLFKAKKYPHGHIK